MIYIKNLKIFNCSIKESFHWSKLPKMKKLMEEKIIKFPYGADLTGAYLTGAYLRGAYLTGADLTGAYLRGADLRGAYLRGADLRGAYLTGADLTGAYLRGAYLTGADLTGADLRGAYLTGADQEKIKIKDFMCVQGLGSQNRTTYIFDTEIGIVIKCGCFFGTEKEFKKQLKKTHKKNQYAKEYTEMLKLVNIRFSRNNEE